MLIALNDFKIIVGWVRFEPWGRMKKMERDMIDRGRGGKNFYMID